MQPTILIGTSTQTGAFTVIQSRATAAVARGTYLFALPGSTGAVKDGWDGILAEQLDILSDVVDFFLSNNSENKGETTLNNLTDSLGTASMVTRWREANPELIDTERDCVAEMCAEIRQAMGVSSDENPTLKVGGSVALLLFKRK